MELAYYPGCSLEGTANDYGRSVVEAFGLLGIKLREIPDWTCCGSTAAHSLSEAMTILLPSKNISIAEEMGLDLLAPCPMCYNRLVYSLDRIKRGLEDSPWPLTGQVSIYDPTRFLSQQEFLRRIREGVKRPLKDLRVVCYYGCQMVRPPKLTGFKEFQNPTTMDKILEALGATVLDWSYKTICCGASIKMGRKEIGLSLSFKLLMKAVEFGADAIVVSCPLCQFNLDSAQFETGKNLLPVFYFTELMILALADSAVSINFKSHLVDPSPLLIEKRLYNL